MQHIKLILYFLTVPYVESRCILKIKRISIYHEFQCTGAACPANCCKGWKIPIDKASYLKFLQEKGIFGTLLRCSIIKGEDIISFRNELGRCPFLGFDRLCTIQKNHGIEYMPLVCKQFPRQLYNLGFFCEETLYLACPEAARLFFAHAQQGTSFVFEETEEDASYEVNTTNDDEAFLEYLLQSRENLSQMLRGDCSYDSMSILHYGQDAQNACLNKTPLPNPFDYHEELSKHYVMDCDIIDKLFFNGFFHPSLKTLSPFLYKLCKKYIKTFGFPNRRNTKTAERRLMDLKEHLRMLLPDLDKLLDRYYEYYLQTNFLDIFEDYSFSKHLLFGMAKTNMLWLFFALYAKSKKHVSIDELVKIMAIYERRAPQMEDALKLINPLTGFM